MQADTPGRENAVGETLDYQCKIAPNKIAVEFKGSALTYAALNELVNRVANGLADAGIGKGAHVGLMMDNKPDFITCVYALARLGAVGIPFNTALFGSVLEYFVDDSDVTAIIADTRHAATLATLPVAKERVRLWVFADDESEGPETGDAMKISLRALESHSSASNPDVRVFHTDPFMILYTSGTTGPSKGVICAHSHLQWISEIGARRVGLTTDDNFYVCMPLFHVAALWYCVGACFWAGATVVLTDRFSASNYWRDIRATRSTVTMIAMSMSVILEKLEPTEDERNNTLRTAWLVPLPPKLRAFEERFGLKGVTNYSMTEITHAVVGYPGEMYDKDPGCAGRLSGDWDVMIADEHDRSVPTGTVGEILVRPRKPGIVFLGYYKKERQTVNLWKNLWFHTGDRGYFDPNGFMYFVDRAKDAIRRRGENISAHEIENGLLAMPAIKEVAAIPVPSPLGEDDLCVYVLRNDSASLTEEEIIRFAQQHLPYFMVPRYVAIVDDLPRTPSHKVQKFMLRQWAEKKETLWDGEQHGFRITGRREAEKQQSVSPK
jgi:crotonobetaine/carnitine-CoA ligase